MINCTGIVLWFKNEFYFVLIHHDTLREKFFEAKIDHFAFFEFSRGPFFSSWFFKFILYVYTFLLVTPVA